MKERRSREWGEEQGQADRQKDKVEVTFDWEGGMLTSHDSHQEYYSPGINARPGGGLDPTRPDLTLLDGFSETKLINRFVSFSSLGAGIVLSPELFDFCTLQQQQQKKRKKKKEKKS